MYFITVLTFILCLIFLCIYQLSKLKFNYWKNKNIPYLEPVFLFGNYAEYMTLRASIGAAVQQLCYKFPNVPCFGAFYGTEPALIVKDPEMIKLVLTKDFYYFSSREITKYTHNEVLTKNVFFSGGNHWKIVRQNMTPVFTSAKMRNMFYLIEKCTHTFENMLDEEVSKCDVLNIRSTMIKYAMGSVGSCVFGVDTRTMDQTIKNNDFLTTGQQIFENTNYRSFKTITRAVWPAIFYGVGFKLFPEKINNFFSELLTGVYQSRDYKPSSRKDFIDLILSFKANNYIVGDCITNMKGGGEKKVELEVNDELLVAQCVSLFSGGFETSATTLTFTLFELAKNQKAQHRAFEEIDSFLKRHHNKMTYDCTSELPYLDACIDEALRLYPVLGIHTREVVDDYTFPTGLSIEKGLRVHVPVHYLHHHPEYFPEPEEYIPERFLPENKHNIIPYTYIPFGEGPRVCIGKRFGKMQMLAGLVTLLKKYRVELAPDMKEKLELDPRARVTQPKGIVKLRCHVREGWEDRVLSRN